ncbi:hypothetical protein F5050DRAFT_1549995, partial [Lentinula boryana]
NCQRAGHLAEECFRKGGGKEGQFPSWWRGKKDVTIGSPSANVISSPMENVPEVAELTQYYGMATSFQTKTGDEIYTDTGASDHFFRSCKDFITY